MYQDNEKLLSYVNMVIISQSLGTNFPLLRQQLHFSTGFEAKLTKVAAINVVFLQGYVKYAFVFNK